MKRIGFVVVTLLLQLAVGEDFYWLRNSNWDEPSNWRLGRVPCGGEVATFANTPANSLIYLKNNVTARRIVLPTNGKIILKPSVTIRFSEQSCTVRHIPVAVEVENEFIGANPRPWECPENWRTSNNLPATRPPCGNDGAIFEEDSAFSVTSNSTISVRSLSVRGVQLQSLRDIRDPGTEFKLNITINPRCRTTPSLCPCPSQAGCKDMCARGLDNCHPNATCVSGNIDRGSFACRCDPGFEGNGQECTGLVVTTGQVSSGVGGTVAGGTVAGVTVAVILIAIIVVIVIAAVIILILYRKHRQRLHYVKDDLIEPGDDDVGYKPAKSAKHKEGVSFDNPLYVASDSNDMQQLIGCEITEVPTEPDPGDTGDFEKVDLALNEEQL